MRRFEPALHGRVWGMRDLRPWIHSHGLASPIGEAWYQCPGLPLLKWIFTTERLSVQVHPDDSYAMAHHAGPGKTEAWYVVHAEPGATLGLGLGQELTREAARAAALDGSIEDLLNWAPVKPGDAVFIPAGTIHAIGAGLVIAEIQQDSDITYRLYDYGRGRELHLDRGLEVADLRPWSGEIRRNEIANGEIRSGVAVLAECPYFRLEAHTSGRDALVGPSPNPAWAIFPAGAGSIHGLPWRQGDVWLIDAGESVRITGSGETFLTGSIPPGNSL